MPLEKAFITNLHTKKSISCLFNPTEYSISKSNQWDPVKVMGENVPVPKFRSGNSMTLNMTLFFDTYADGLDVREYTEQLFRLMYVEDKLKSRKNNKGRPPACQFNWGKAWGFEAIITQMTQRFTLFLEDGTPVRATVDVTFQQVGHQGTYQSDQKKRKEIEPRKRVVKAGERLDWIAFDEYRDSSQWKHIAENNDLSDPKKVEVGTVLKIPPLKKSADTDAK